MWYSARPLRQHGAEAPIDIPASKQSLDVDKAELVVLRRHERCRIAGELLIAAAPAPSLTKAMPTPSKYSAWALLLRLSTLH